MSAILNRRVGIMFPLGFSSGLPLALSAGTLQAWMTVEGIDIRTIGIIALMGIPYTLKFLWSPIMDRFVPPFLGRRRGWLVVTQTALLILIAVMAGGDPKGSAVFLAFIAFLVAFASASQDIVADAYRTDLLHEEERGLGVAVFVAGYRIGMLVSGALALALSESIGWRASYLIMAVLMVVGILAALAGPEPEKRAHPPLDLASAVANPFRDFFSRKGAVLILLLIILYKLGDAFAGTLTTPFLIRGAGFSPGDVGLVNKGLGLFALIFGAMWGGALMARMGLYKSLMVFGILQALSNLSFMALALNGKSFPFMVFAVGLENLCGGMGTAAFVALLMALCNIDFSATQFALLSSIASVGRVLIAPISGFVVDSFGWPQFFLATFFSALPGLLLLWFLKTSIKSLDGGSR